MQDPHLFPEWACARPPGICLALGFYLVNRDNTVVGVDLSDGEREALRLLAGAVERLAHINLPAPTVLAVTDDSLMGHALRADGAAAGYSPSMVPELRSTVVILEHVLREWRETADVNAFAECLVHELLHGFVARCAFGDRVFDSTLPLATDLEEAVVRLLVAVGATEVDGIHTDEDHWKALGEIYSAEAASLVACAASSPRGALSHLVELAVAAHTSESIGEVVSLLNGAARQDWTATEWSTILPPSSP